MEDAFLTALAANFDDETTRLVYADWLDERGDPRGQFLRAEVEWARLSTDNKRFPAALARLSISQRGIDSDWMTRVSRLSKQVRQTWDTAASGYNFFGGRVTYEDRDLGWPRWVAVVYKAFSLHLGVASVAQRFCVPADYDVFMGTIGGGWSARVDLWDAAVLHETTAENCAQFKEFCRLEGGLWLNIGRKSFYSLFLCCDSNHPMFGHIVERRTGAHPWFDGLESLTLPAPTFLQYVVLNGHRELEVDDILDDWFGPS